jgi:hypothetical protein
MGFRSIVVAEGRDRTGFFGESLRVESLGRPKGLPKVDLVELTIQTNFSSRLSGAVEGPGTIDGNGAKFFTGKGDNTGPGQRGAGGYLARPHLLVWFKCTNLVVRNIFLTPTTGEMMGHSATGR